MDMNIKRRTIIFVLIVVISLLGTQYLQPKKLTAIILQEQNQEAVIINETETSENSIFEPEIQSKEIVIHVAGAVENPGVYVLYEGQRIEDAIQKAGIAENADADALNRAAILTDGQKIVVPSSAESHIIDQEVNTTVQNDTGIASPDHRSTKININTATQAQLMKLPGIGEVKAAAVIRYRNEHGGFQTVEQLLQVNGIGTAIYSQISDFVYV